MSKSQRSFGGRITVGDGFPGCTLAININALPATSAVLLTANAPCMSRTIGGSPGPPRSTPTPATLLINCSVGRAGRRAGLHGRTIRDSTFVTLRLQAAGVGRRKCTMLIELDVIDAEVAREEQDGTGLAA